MPTVTYNNMGKHATRRRHQVVERSRSKGYVVCVSLLLARSPLYTHHLSSCSSSARMLSTRGKQLLNYREKVLIFTGIIVVGRLLLVVIIAGTFAKSIGLHDDG